MPFLTAGDFLTLHVNCIELHTFHAKRIHDFFIFFYYVRIMISIMGSAS